MGVAGCAAPIAAAIKNASGAVSMPVSTTATMEAEEAVRSAAARADECLDRAAGARERSVDIKRNGSQASAKGDPQWFTGEVRIDQPFQAEAPARVGGATVTFEPGARTAWHTHPLGQTLFVTFGLGWVQREGGPVEEIRPGDMVWIAPGEKHWHGATPTTPMTHIAVVERLNGKNIDWLEKVSDAQYRR